MDFMKNTSTYSRLGTRLVFQLDPRFRSSSARFSESPQIDLHARNRYNIKIQSYQSGAQASLKCAVGPDFHELWKH